MMRARCLLLTAFLFVLICLRGVDRQSRAATDANSDLKAIVNGNNQFAFDLYGRLRTEKGNLFFSPNSISTALAMTYGGANGDTEKQMADVLHFDLPQDQLHQAFSALRNRLNARDRKVELRVANRLWGQSGYNFLPAYLQLTKDRYGAELGEVDFIHQTEAARKAINSWVEAETKDKIKDLIPSGAVNQDTRLVLTNAIYFKGKWDSQFEKTATKDLPFRVSAEAKVDVPLMFQKHDFKYGKVDDLQILELPYVGKDLSMVVLLPNETNGLKSLEAKLTQANLEKWTSAWHEQEVLVYLPTFAMISQFSLNDVLQSLGMTSAFNPEADFSGMDGKKDLYLSAVVHQAFVDINEEGTEAAAATGVVVEEAAVRVPLTFRADHPFVFLIRDVKTGSILFMGRLVSPPKS